MDAWIWLTNLDPNGTNPGTFFRSDTVHLARSSQMYWTWSEKIPGLVPFGVNLTNFGSKSGHQGPIHRHFWQSQRFMSLIAHLYLVVIAWSPIFFPFVPSMTAVPSSSFLFSGHILAHCPSTAHLFFCVGDAHWRQTCEILALWHLYFYFLKKLDF